MRKIKNCFCLVNLSELAISNCFWGKLNIILDRIIDLIDREDHDRPDYRRGRFQCVNIDCQTCLSI